MIEPASTPASSPSDRASKGGAGANRASENRSARRRGRRRRAAPRSRERAWRERGYDRVAGVDEVGRGPLAGPVVAAAVILPERVRLPGATDSKLLTPLARERLHALILARAADVAWAAVGPTVIDRINVLQASYLAMRLALERLRTPPDVVLVDGNPVPGLDPSESIVGGDRKELCIACASIVAKVVRDRMMDIYDAVYEGYGFATNRGYATADHLRAVRVSGPCPIHRWSYQPVAQTSFVDEL